jgi:capsular polysaccharide transport system ATP-binding protein
MIYFRSVAKTYRVQEGRPKLVLRPTTIALPTDRRVAILGGRMEGKTTLLRLLSGFEAPDSGEIVAPLRLSPIGNSRTLLHPVFSGAENIQIVARMIGVDADLLLTAVDRLCGIGHMLEKPLHTQDAQRRQLLEIAVLSVLPFDCYLLDNSHSMSTGLLERYFDAAQRRGAGMIFATGQPRQVYRYADYAVVIKDHTVCAYNQVEEAIESYERKSA